MDIGEQNVTGGIQVQACRQLPHREAAAVAGLGAQQRELHPIGEVRREQVHRETLDAQFPVREQRQHADAALEVDPTVCCLLAALLRTDAATDLHLVRGHRALALPCQTLQGDAQLGELETQGLGRPTGCRVGHGVGNPDQPALEQRVFHLQAPARFGRRQRRGRRLAHRALAAPRRRRLKRLGRSKRSRRGRRGRCGKTGGWRSRHWRSDDPLLQIEPAIGRAHRRDHRLHDPDAAEHDVACRHIDLDIAECQLLEGNGVLAIATLAFVQLEGIERGLFDGNPQSRRIGGTGPVETRFHAEPAVDPRRERLRKVGSKGRQRQAGNCQVGTCSRGTGTPPHATPSRR